MVGSSSLRELCFANERHPEDRRGSKRLGSCGAWIAKPGTTGQRLGQRRIVTLTIAMVHENDSKIDDFYVPKSMIFTSKKRPKRRVELG